MAIALRDTARPPIPDDIVQEIASFVDGEDQWRWRLGDRLTELVEEFGRYYGGRAGLFRQIARQGRIDDSTLRDRQVMSEFFPPAVREEFEMLTYSHLRACKSAGARWREYATRAVSEMLTVRQVRALIAGDGEMNDAIWRVKWEKILRMAEEILQDESAPAYIHQWARSLLEVDWD